VDRARPVTLQHVAELVNDGVAVPQQLHVERQVVQPLSVDENLRNIMGDRGGNKRHWPNLEARPNDDEKVHLVLVLRYGAVELVRQTLPEEDYVWLHDRNIRERRSPLHPSWS